MDSDLKELGCIGSVGCISILFSLIPFGLFVWAVVYIVDALK